MSLDAVAQPSTDATPTIFVLFGATGDLSRRLVIPSVFQLYAAGMLPEKFALIGLGRSITTTADLVARAKDGIDEFGSVKSTDPAWENFAATVQFAPGDFTVDDPGTLPQALEQTRAALNPDNPDAVQVVYYMALPPVLFGPFSLAMKAHGLTAGARVIFEKPFGTSPESFTELCGVVDEAFDESQVYRIDHFLGKEATQNLHVARFANTFFETSWDNRSIHHVEIDVPESLDVADRAEFYDATGAVLDMLVTHLLQVAAEVAMEPPASIRAADLQAARAAATATFRPLDPSDVVLGQFAGYHDIDKIPADSQTDTFVAAKLWIDSPRWAGVPFLLRTGKQLAVSAQRVSIVFAEPQGPLGDIADESTVLTFDLGGNGAVDLRFAVKEPGPGLDVLPGNVRLSLDTVGVDAALTPYARLIADFLAGDRSLFTAVDSLTNTWKTVAPLLANRPAVIEYPKGSMGPAAADALVPDGSWILQPEQVQAPTIAS